jgi:tRNA A-37 threonylcarbamoyl transferase component Bud32
MNPMTELELFEAAIAVADSDLRAALLDRECAGKPELRARLHELLAAHVRSNPLLDQPHQPIAIDGHGEALETTCNASTETAGTVIAGKYKLLQKIGEGGMGTVWMADQSEPVKRRVALKLMRVERAHSKTILSRFEAERQAIALMDHPHIARLLDAGATSSGQPFFVMELVKGVPLTDFCDAQKLGIPERLKLFMQICAAVQHAHQKGIIHRDLKPSNILVEAHDGKPVPKVIDFGLAKATTGMQLTEHTLFTAFGSVIGTPLYMAPEQANFNAVDVDTRADIYALGVILYELLTGTTPIARETFKKAALDEMLKLIREQEAPTPSSRLSSSDSAPSVAANRQMDPAKLGLIVKGELDWIVLKALAKERERRYETANGFAGDIERFLNQEPVTAGPPTTAYRLRKFVRRNRGQVIAASLVLFTLVGGVIGTTAGLFEARRQAEIARGKEQEANDEKQKALHAAHEEWRAKQREAERAEGERRAKEREADRAEGERQAKLEADAKREEAERNLAFAKKGNEILGSVFAGLDPKKIAESGRPLQDVLRENLTQAVTELEGSVIGEPLEVAGMQDTLGKSLWGLGEESLAVEVVQKALATRKAKLGPDHPDTLTSMNNLAAVYEASGQLAKAVLLYEETLEKQKATLGADHIDTLTSMNNLAIAYKVSGQFAKATSLLEETLEKRKAKLGREDINTLVSMNNLAAVYQAGGQLAKAVPLYEETLEKTKDKLGPDHPDTLTSMNNLAEAYRASSQLAKALRLHEATLEKRKAKVGRDHPDTLRSLNNLAAAYYAGGQVGKALPLLEETMEKMKAKLGPDHPNTLGSMNNLAVAYLASGQLAKAVPLYEETLEKTKAKLGLDHPDTLTSMNNLAMAYRDNGQVAKVVPLLEETLEKRKTKLSPDHPDTLTSMNNLALAYQENGQLAKALSLYEETLEKMKAKLGPVHPNTLKTKEGVEFTRALSTAEGRYQAKLTEFGPNHIDTLLARRDIAQMYMATNRLDDAELVLLEILHGMNDRSADDAIVLFTTGLLRSCLTQRQQATPETWQASNTQSLLGGALLGQKKYAEAEALLVEGYEGLKTREETIPKQRGGELRIPEAIDRLIELYNVLDKPDEAHKWQTERAKYLQGSAKTPEEQ